MAEFVALVGPIISIVLRVAPHLPRPHSVAGRLKKGDKLIADAHDLFDKHREKMTKEQLNKCRNLLKTFVLLPLDLVRTF